MRKSINYISNAYFNLKNISKYVGTVAGDKILFDHDFHLLI